MSRTHAVELCQMLKTEAAGKQEDSTINNLRLRILDFFITRNVPDDIFEELLKARLNDPNGAKENSKIICAEILQAWYANYGYRR